MAWIWCDIFPGGLTAAFLGQEARGRIDAIARTLISYLGVHRVALDRVAAAHLDGLGDGFGVFARERKAPRQRIPPQDRRRARATHPAISGTL